VDKIKTIGDAYIACAGIFSLSADHASATCMLACAMQKKMRQVSLEYSLPKTHELKIRIGVHTGNMIGGVVGQMRYGLDLWGSDIAIAEDMESNGAPDRVNMSEMAYRYSTLYTILT
jgi:class 3 adenylate cyclase